MSTEKLTTAELNAELTLHAVFTDGVFLVTAHKGDKQIAQEQFVPSEFADFITKMHDPFSVGQATIQVGDPLVFRRFKKYFRNVFNSYKKQDRT